MEIGTEITKVFGQEMAKLYADKVSEEELIKAADIAWACLRESRSNGWNHYDSELDKLIKAELFKRLKAAVTAILDSEKNNQTIQAMAEPLVASIREETQKKIVQKASDQLSELYGNGIERQLSYIAGSISHLQR